MRVVRQAYMVLAYLFVLGVVIQVFLAGLGIFGDLRFAEGDDLDPHRFFGFTVMSLIPILMFLAALVGRMRWTFIGLSVLLFLMVFFQSFWIDHSNGRALKAVHPTMAIVMFALAHFLAQRAGRLVKGEEVLGAQPAPASG
jgi:dolichyl-phosphate-mannose--protein O-mannosyl transferase